jgi:putative ABC transport system ATP-binding protein
MSVAAAPLVSLEGVHKTYVSGARRVEVLRGVDLSIERGELVVVTGASGAGKTTLLEVIGCLTQTSAGTYRLAGERIDSLPSNRLADLRSRQIGFVFQAFHLLARLDALGNVALPLVYQGVGRRERRRRAQEMLERVGLGDRIGHRPAELSGGEAQRVAIARALVGGPKVLLADEPTGNLDAQTGRQILDLLEDLHRRGHTILIVTHDRDIADRAPRVVVMRDGRVCGTAPLLPGRSRCA